MPQRLDRDDLAGAGSPGQCDHAQPDRPAPDDGDHGADARLAQVVRVQRDPERLEHRRVRVAQGVGHRMQQDSRPGDDLAQTAVVGAVPREPDRGAQVAVALQALLAPPARERGIHRDPPPVVGPALDDPGELVPEHQGTRQAGVANAALREPVQVGAAQPDRRHAHQALARARGRQGLVGDPDVSHTVQPRDLHDCVTTHDGRTRRASPWLGA